MKLRLSILLPVLLLLGAPGLAAADTGIGEVVLVRNSVLGTLHSGPTKPLAVGDGLALGLRVETGADSAANFIA